MIAKLNNQEGASLILVVVVFMFVSILTVAIITVSSSEQVQSIEQDHSIQAELLALSGAEIMSDYIINHQEEFLSKYNDYNNNFPLNLNLQGETVTIEVSDLSDGLEISSTATVINETIERKLMIDKVDTTPNYLFGEFFTDTDDMTDYEAVSIPTPDITFTTRTIGNGDGNYQNTDEETINLNQEVTQINSLTVRSDGELSFSTGLNNRSLIVNNLIINGDFNMVDDGKIFLYVTGNADINSEFLNANENLIIILGNGASIDVDANGDFNAYIFAPTQNVNLRGNMEYIGGIIAKSYSTNGGNITESYIPPTDALSLKEHIKYDETFSYRIDGYH